jgi:hypothetical protein
VTLTIHLWHVVAALAVLSIGTGLYVGSRPPQGIFDIGGALIGMALVGGGLLLGIGFLLGSCV